MPTYFLHLHECGTVTEDDDGLELPDLAAARRVATEAARDVMAGEVKQGRLCLSCCIVIGDREGGEVDRIPFRDVLAITGV